MKWAAKFFFENNKNTVLFVFEVGGYTHEIHEFDFELYEFPDICISIEKLKLDGERQQ